MVFRLSCLVRPAKLFSVLALAAILLSCSPAERPATSAPPGQQGTDDGNSREVSLSPTPVFPDERATRTARQGVVDLQRTSLAQSLDRRVAQTKEAASLETQAAEPGGSEQEPAQATSSGSPTPETIVFPPSTPVPDTLLDRFFQPLASFDGVLPGLLIDLEVSPDGTVWVVNENGVASHKGSKWTVHFPDVMLWLAGFDDSGRTWLINEAGTAVLSWNGSEWQVYGDREGWLPIRSQQLLSRGDDMVTDRAGRVWMTTFQDIRSFDGRNWTIHTLRELGFEPDEETADYEGYYFPALAQDMQGNLWVGNCDMQGELLVGQGARWFDGAAWQGKVDPTATGCVRDIAVDAEGRIWLGVDDLLWRYDQKSRSWIFFELPEPPADMRIGWIEDIQFGAGGEPWLAVVLCGGASCGSQIQRYRLEPGNWIPITGPDELDLHRLAIDFGGNAWLFTRERLLRLEENTLEAVSGLEIFAVTRDSRGLIYLAAKRDREKLIFIQRENP
jgi:hypothetical protein